jgi:transcriptional regulator with AAA-type ATPase domain/tetratricopeptide (TPR) repeat protein
MNPLPELIGESHPMGEVRADIERMVRRQPARRPPPVLIQGETGTGKGMVASLLHARGSRRAGPFVELNCAAIPETLLEAELFGFARGSFTDAREAKSGLFQAAHRGTIFLDEVSLLAPELQAKLLKVIEDGVVRRLGSTRSEPVDVAIISASNDDLEAQVRVRRFREDLYHRLAVWVLKLPALRQRGDDVLVLAEHFLARVCRDYDLPPKAFVAEARAALRSYGWPGNVRELANVIERVALLSEGPWVRAENLRLPGTSGPGQSRPARELPVDGETGAANERDLLAQALTRTNWNISQTAALLRISRNTVRHRIAKHQLQPPGASPRPESPAVPAAPEPRATSAGTATPAAGLRWERCPLALLLVELEATGDGSRHDASRILEEMIHKVNDFGGIVDHVTPTGLTATFGLEWIEDPVSCAALTAMALQNQVKSARPGGLAGVGVRIAVSAGSYPVGRTDGQVFVDMSARREAGRELEAMLAAAESGTTVISAGTLTFLERRFDVAATPITPADGEPVFRLDGRIESGFRRGGHTSNFVGRHQELELLRAVFEAARSGRGHVVDIVGDPGMGKSRLVFEFHQALLNEALLFVEGRCVSYGRKSPYLPVLEIVRRLCGIAEGDQPDEMDRTVGAALDVLGMPASESALVSHLLGARDAPELSTSTSPEVLKARIVSLLVQMVLRNSQHLPLVVVIEDLHWIDTVSEEFIATLAGAIVMAPVLVVLTHRPGYVPAWITKSYATQLALRPLSAEDSLSVLRSVLPSERLDAELTAVILERAAGNPLFLEELSRLAGDKARGTDVPVPTTIYDALAARINLIPEEARSVIRAAAVIGRTVPAALLEAVCGEPVDGALRELVRLEFLVEQPSAGERLYTFRHPLVLEVVYESLVIAERQSLHALVGREMERLWAPHLEAIYGQLARHFSRAEADESALKYLLLCAQKAATNYAPAEALTALEDALRHLHRLPRAQDGERDRMAVQIVLRQAEVLHLLGRVDESISVLLGQASRIKHLGDAITAAYYYFLLGRSQTLLGQHEAIESATLAMRTAESAGDVVTLGKAHYLLALEHCWLGEYERGLYHGAEAMRVLETNKEPYWVGQTHWVIGFNHAFRGELAAAMAAAERTCQIGREIADKRLASFGEWTIGFIHTLTGKTLEAIDHCRRGTDSATDPHSRAIALGFLGYAYLRDGQFKEALTHLEPAIGQLREFGFRRLEGALLGALGEAHLGLGETARARMVAGHGLEICRTSRYPVGMAWCWRALARILLAAGAAGEAQQAIDEALGLLGSVGANAELELTRLVAAEISAPVPTSEE